MCAGNHSEIEIGHLLQYGISSGSNNLILDQPDSDRTGSPSLLLCRSECKCLQLKVPLTSQLLSLSWDSQGPAGVKIADVIINLTSQEYPTLLPFRRGSCAVRRALAVPATAAQPSPAPPPRSPAQQTSRNNRDRDGIVRETQRTIGRADPIIIVYVFMCARMRVLIVYMRAALIN